MKYLPFSIPLVLILFLLFPFILLAQEVTLMELMTDISSWSGLGGLALSVAICQVLVKLTKVTALRDFWDKWGNWKAYYVLVLGVIVGGLEAKLTGGNVVSMMVATVVANQAYKQYSKPIVDLVKNKFS